MKIKSSIQLWKRAFKITIYWFGTWRSEESKPPAPWLWVTSCERRHLVLLACWRRAPPGRAVGSVRSAGGSIGAASSSIPGGKVTCWKRLSELTHKNAACNLFIFLCLGALYANPRSLLIQSHLSQWNCACNQADFSLMHFWNMFESTTIMQPSRNTMLSRG